MQPDLSGDLFLAGAGVATGIATWVGGTAALRYAGRLPLIQAFSAGAVIGVALLDLAPEAIDLGRAWYRAGALLSLTAAGFVVYLVIDRMLMSTGGGEAGRGHFGAGSLTLHSLLDGLGIGLGFQVSSAVGLVLACAVLAHDVADGINTVTLSLAGSGAPKVARRWLLADALAPALGIAVSRLITAPPQALALALALFSGFFLYIGAGELLPASWARRPEAGTTVATALGLAMIWIVVRLASA